MVNIIITVQDFRHIVEVDAMSVPFCGYALFVHLGYRKPFVSKRIGYDKHGILIHFAQMEINGRLLCFKACFHGVIQINPKHPGKVDGFHMDGIDVIRNINIYFDILVGG